MISLECEGLGRINAQAHDISMEGMYIETDGRPLRHNTRVRTHFEMEANGISQRYSIDGRIVHKDERGAGIMFRQLDVRLCRQLHDVLYPEDRPAA